MTSDGESVHCKTPGMPMKEVKNEGRSQRVHRGEIIVLRHKGIASAVFGPTSRRMCTVVPARVKKFADDETAGTKIRYQIHIQIHDHKPADVLVRSNKSISELLAIFRINTKIPSPLA